MAIVGLPIWEPGVWADTVWADGVWRDEDTEVGVGNPVVLRVGEMIRRTLVLSVAIEIAPTITIEIER